MRTHVALSLSALVALSGCAAAAHVATGAQVPLDGSSDRYGVEVSARAGVAALGILGASVSLRAKAAPDYGAIPILGLGLAIIGPNDTLVPYLAFDMGVFALEALPVHGATIGISPRGEVGAMIVLGSDRHGGWGLTPSVALEWMERLEPASRGEAFFTFDVGFTYYAVSELF